MELVSLSVPVLMAAATIIHLDGRRTAKGRALPIARLAVLLLILSIWVWAWSQTPPSAFPSPAWRHAVFAPAAIGVALWCLAACRRIQRPRLEA